MKFNVHAGHNPDGKVACGAVGLIKESTEARKVKDEVIRLLKLKGHIVYDTTVNDGVSQSDVVNKIVAKCNKNLVDWDISIHFNSGGKDPNGNGKTTGVEVIGYNTTHRAMAERICSKISALGFTNRGLKTNSKLGVLKTKNKNLLVECCFVDDKDDVNKYNYKTMAKAIAEALINETIQENVSSVFKNGDYTGRKARVTATTLNVRWDRGTNYEVVGKLNKGYVVNLSYCLNGWISIEGFKGNKGLGYVSTDYLQLI